MKKLTILINNTQTEVNVLRYYENNGSRYLIFSREEIDENDYEKLYAIKVINNNGVLTATNIVDDNEWNSVKDTIKVIIKANKEGQKSVNDLDPSVLVNLGVSETRIFKLNKQLAELLGQEVSGGEELTIEPEPVTVPEVDLGVTPEATPVVPSTPVPSPAEPVIPTPEPAPAQPEVDYKKLYEEEKERVMGLTLELTDLKGKLENIKDLIK